MTIDKLTNRK